MNKILSRFSILVALLCAPMSTTAEERTMMTKDQNKVLTTVQSMTEAFHTGNIDGVMDSYESGAAVVFEPGNPITDPNILTQMFQGAFTLNPKFDYHGHEVIVAGDIAIHTAPWTMKGKTPDGQIVEQSGLSVAVLRKQTDGKWLMVIDNPHGGSLLE